MTIAKMKHHHCVGLCLIISISLTIADTLKVFICLFIFQSIGNEFFNYAATYFFFIFFVESDSNQGGL